MPTLLHVDASPRGDSSISRQVSAAFADAWKQAHPDGKVVYRDLTTSNLAFVDLEWIGGAYSAPEQQSESQKKAIAISNTVIAELLSADHIILGTPMYNFSTPAVLKAWIDHLIRSGKTFKASATGVEGLATGKKLTVAIASGFNYTPGAPYESYNRESEYLKQIFGFIGITDIQFILAGDTSNITQGKIDAKDFVAPYIEEAKKLASA